MNQPGPRIAREQRTIRAMVDIYCRDHHPPDGWHRCEECESFLAYAWKRLARCIYQEDKPVCSACPVHCYKPDRREQARRVMRHAGPRMILYHPLQAIRHMLEERRERPPAPRARRGETARGADPAPARQDSRPEEPTLPPAAPCV